MRILAAQINPIIGDLAGNAKLIIDAIARGKSQGADLIVFPELALSGYPPEDIILLPHFMEEIPCYLDEIIGATEGIAAIVGLPRYNPHQLEKRLFNSAALIENKILIDFADKILLPTYDVFDERRYFEPGETVKVWDLKGKKIGITICEDLWQHSGILQSTTYRRDPVDEIKGHNLSCLINISASPYHVDKFGVRLEVCVKAARSLQCPILLCNQVGGNDSLIFDGYSLFVDQRGLLQLGKGFEEEDLWIDLALPQKPIIPEINPTEDLYRALILGVSDYFRKLGFKKGCLGLSGGIDSAVVACIAAEALGSDHVLALGMPSPYTARKSNADSALLSERLGIEYKEIPIDDPFKSFLSLVSPDFEERSPDVAEENLQARIRGILLMAFSNKYGYIVLSTGNKSELALGYSTLYGDMCGGLAVLGDVTKNQVYALAHWINRHKEIIPLHVIQRAPSAELRPNQKDSDSLPDYAVIDHVLQGYVEQHRSPAWIAEHYNYPLPLVQDLIKRIHQNEYKRRQSAPSLRVSEKAFSVGRRFPIVQRWV